MPIEDYLLGKDRPKKQIWCKMAIQLAQTITNNILEHHTWGNSTTHRKQWVRICDIFSGRFYGFGIQIMALHMQTRIPQVGECINIWKSDWSQLDLRP